ncbi:MAG: hypothetical protein HC775_16745 [Hyellaceae cyanobacterium CSU_1_1]|nr:hypothetical protein [Pleurocapsa sp. CRU_1_2]NJR47256.1 hypothetical protein [Hyellaceae cyanobacterium CSU_1_1]
MQPNLLMVDSKNYRIYNDENNVNYHAEHIPVYALRRIFNLAVNVTKTIVFTDLDGFWAIDSLYISSPSNSDIQIDIVDSNGVVFYTDIYPKDTTPRTFPTVLINNTLTIRVTAKRSAINLLLLYLKPAHLAYSQDF